MYKSSYSHEHFPATKQNSSPLVKFHENNKVGTRKNLKHAADWKSYSFLLYSLSSVLSFVVPECADIAMEIIHISKNLERRILKPKRSLENNNNLQQANSIKKCLFGIPQAEDVEKLLQQQIKDDWERIQERFGINIEDIENMEGERLDSYTPKKRKESSKRKATKRRRLFQQPPNERKITDFYQVRKTGHPEEKEA